MQTKLIPQVREFPWIGQLGGIARDPLQLLLNLALTYGPIVRFTVLGKPIILISDPDYIREVLITKADLFPKADRDLAIMGPLFGYGLLTTNGAQHRTYRKLAQPAFHAKRIAGYADTVVNFTQAMTATWREGETRDISAEMLRTTMYIVAKTLFDTEPAHMADRADQIGDAIHQLQKITDYDFTWYGLIPQWIPNRANRQRQPARQALNALIDEMVATRRAQAVDGVVADRGDLLSMLMLSEDENGQRLNDTEVRDEAINLFAAGHETTSNALTWIWYLLSQYPAVEAKLHAELDQVLGNRLPTLRDLATLPYTQQVVKEGMRLYPPAWVLNSRQAATAVTLDGYVIPKDARLFISPYVMHHLPQYFADPAEFRPERFTPAFEESLPRYAYMPFGGGPRVCIGNAFAMMEAQLVLATVAQQYSLQLAPHANVATEPLITLTAKYGMPMHLVARHKPAPLPSLPIAQPLTPDLVPA
ncbi:MAG: cytochrome P450 [Caldilineaceae bacterium]|nr:cytochrome P450 [Caldilineaceae bacterium]